MGLVITSPTHYDGSMNHDIQALALYFAPMLDGNAYSSPEFATNSEIEPGVRSIHNDAAGQSRRVIHHLESNLIFKGSGWANPLPESYSRRSIGVAVLDDVIYKVRLPEFRYVVVDDEQTVEVNEYVDGVVCCEEEGGWCEHAYAVKRATNCEDAHNGNYMIVGDEIVLFDFEGIRLQTLDTHPLSVIG